ncbi:MAG: hypothetical protein MPJ24_03080 [Pirellulaceae bacterium]|nr:hypothetical protein [Pirellulaceae bacterium]
MKALRVVIALAMFAGITNVASAQLLRHQEICGKACHTSCKPGEKKFVCYDVVAKEVCIPAVTFPWERCCNTGPKCGKVIVVNTLKKSSYVCPTTKYNHTIGSDAGCGGCKSCHRCCGEGEVIIEEVQGPTKVPTPPAVKVGNKQLIIPATVTLSSRRVRSTAAQALVLNQK